MLLINYIKSGDEIDILININIFLNHYIDSFEFEIEWFYVIIIIIIFLD